MAKTLLFSQEYLKVTKGMFGVWIGYSLEAARTRQVAVLLNHEHWAFLESCEAVRGTAGLSVRRLPFDMPATWLKRLLPPGAPASATRAAYILGRMLDLAFAPLIVPFLCWHIFRSAPQAVVSHTGGWPAGALCRWILLAAWLMRVPRRILVVHSHPVKYSTGVAAALLAPWPAVSALWLARCATSIVTVSDSVKSALEVEVFRRPVVRIHNGIRQSSAGSPASRSLGWTPMGLAVGFVGALHPMKGAHVLLEAFSSIELPCELALLGPAAGPVGYVQSLRQRAAACANRVSFLGFQDDVDGFMRKIALLVVPSVAFESFGMVILEAMRYAKPVICSDFGGMKEIVENGTTGLVVPAGDPAALAAAMRTLLTDAAARQRMGEAGYDRLAERFTLRGMVDQYDRLCA